MATLDWTLAPADDAVLVHLVVRSDVTERVRIDNCIDGPVWAPRRQGVRAEGWDDGGYGGVVAAGDRLVLGYASPGEPVEPPAEIAATEPAAPDASTDVTPTAVVRRLGEAGPPREAVPDGDTARTSPVRSGGDGSSPDRSDRSAPDGDGRGDGTRGGESTTRRTAGDGETETPREAPPDPTDSWLSAVEARADDAERLSAVESVAEASAAVESVGGQTAVRDLRRALAADRRAVEPLADRTDELARRLASAEVPVETLAQLA